MKIMRVKKDGQSFYAVLCGDTLRRIQGVPYETIAYTGTQYSLNDVETLAPCEPSKIVGVGLNYAEHAGEMQERLVGNPILFLKPPTSVIAHGQAIVYPDDANRVDFEAELGVVIKTTCKNVPVEHALDYVFGYTLLNDVTARDLQSQDGQWTRSKSFDTFCPFGPFIDTQYDPRGKRVSSVLNGIVKQDASMDDMLFGVAELISFSSRCMTLLAGDVIATGTPQGIGPMQRGDTIEIRIEGLGSLSNRVE